MFLQKLLKKETVGESAGIVLGFTILQRVLQTGRGIVFARILGPSEYGVYTLAFFFIPIIAGIARLGIPSSFSRYVPLYEKQGMMKSFIGKTYVLAVGASAVVGLTCLLFSDHISKLIYNSIEHKNIIIICLLSLLPYSLFHCLSSTFIGLRVFKMSSLMKFLQFLVYTALGIGLVVIYRSALSVIIANFIALIPIIAIFGLVLMYNVTGSESQIHKIQEAGFYKKILKFSVWFIFSPIVFSLFKYTDRWMLNRFLGLHDVGIYSVASNLTGMIFMVGVITGNVLRPTLSSVWEDGDKKRAISILDLSIRGNTLILLVGAVLLMLFKNQIINLLYGNQYAASSTCVGILLTFWLLNSIYMIIGGYTTLIEKTYIPLLSIVTGLVSNIILNYILIPMYGIVGAAMATTISFGIILIVIFFWCYKEGFSINVKTLLVCVFPCIFVFNIIVVAVVFIVIIGIVFGTEFLVTAEEKRTLYRQLRRFIPGYVPEQVD